MSETHYRLAIIADAHFHDPTGDFGGIGATLNGRRRAFRPWAEMRTAGRAVNESALALRTAFERIAAAGVRHVVLAGDYSDDGQRENIARLSALLHDAEAQLGLRIFALPGNHDLYGVAGKHVAVPFVTTPGNWRLATSDPDMRDAFFTSAMRRPGQLEALRPLSAFGLCRRGDELHWECPFGSSDRFQDRQFLAQSENGGTAHHLIDASYLVEPAPGLWLLMIDDTVFVPRDGIADPRRKRAFLEPSDAGWDAVLKVKPFIIDWIADVVRRARALGKILLPISHFPVLPPFEGETDEEAHLFGNSTLHRRKPSRAVVERLAEAGLQLHVGGHLHVNSVTRSDTAFGPFTDVSLPSPVTFAPAIVLIEADAAAVRFESLSLADMALCPDAMALYSAEGAMFSGGGFGDFLAERFRERVVTRRLPRALSPEILAALMSCTTADLPDLFNGGAAEPLEHLPLATLVIETLMLREAGPLALPFLPRENVETYRLLSAHYSNAHPSCDPLALWMHALFSVLSLALTRIDAPGARVLLYG